MHIALLGDSTLDNGRYAEGGPSVSEHLASAVGPAASVRLLAVDGHTTRQVPGQLAQLPSDTTHLVLSVSGNDALGYIGILQKPTRSVSDGLLQLDDVLGEFEDYRSCLQRVPGLDARLHDLQRCVPRCRGTTGDLHDGPPVR